VIGEGSSAKGDMTASKPNPAFSDVSVAFTADDGGRFEVFGAAR
jgi:hypothetical protein